MMKHLFELITGNPIIFSIVLIIILVQYFYFFRKTKKDISELRNFFPDISKGEVISVIYTPSSIHSKKDLDIFVESPDLKDESTPVEFDSDIVSLVRIPCTGEQNKSFQDIIHKTNVYLCKNSGASADFSLLKDICDRQIDICEEEIQNSINAPLYLGLAGTFLGIITGLWDIDLAALTGEGLRTLAPFQHLIGGVVIAMLASLSGLTFTIINSQLNYKKAAKKADSDKDEYFDFLQRELMPTLSTTMASSLNELKRVLGNFVGNFGKNLDSYTDSIAVLNDNIKGQHDVLVEINKLNLSKTSAKIAETFNSMKSVADGLEVFRGYEEELNKTMHQVSEDLKRTLDNVSSTVCSLINTAGIKLSDTIADAGERIDKIYENAGDNLSKTINQVGVSVGSLENVINAFDDFGEGLKLVVENQTKYAELQETFKKAIETHFPVGSIGREMWQKEYDQLQKEAIETSRQLHQELAASTLYIKNFADNNKDFFVTCEQLTSNISGIVKYAAIQVDCYNSLKDEIEALRKDNKEKQVETANLHKSLLDAIKTMTLVLNSKK